MEEFFYDKYDLPKEAFITYSNKVNLFEDTFYDGGSITVDGAKLHCWKSGGHGQETYLQVVENSCNLLVNTRTHLNS